MDPLQVGLFLRWFSKWSVNILAVLMVGGGVHLVFAGEDRDDNAFGAASIMLGASLFALVED
jgi:hypothetical protein